MSSQSTTNHTNTSDANLVRRTLTLTSLAVLKVDIDERRHDYIDYLVSSFVLSVLGKHRPQAITDNLIADMLLQEFGLKVPVKAVQHVLRRMSKDGYSWITGKSIRGLTEHIEDRISLNVFEWITGQRVGFGSTGKFVSGTKSTPAA